MPGGLRPPARLRGACLAAAALAVLALGLCGQHRASAQSFLTSSNAAATTHAGSAGRPRRDDRQQRYRALAGLLSASEHWANKVRDKRLAAQLEISEAELAQLQARSRGSAVHPQQLAELPPPAAAAHQARARSQASPQRLAAGKGTRTLSSSSEGAAAATTELRAAEAAFRAYSTTSKAQHSDRVRDATAVQQRKRLARAEAARDSLVLSSKFTEDEQKHALAQVPPAPPGKGRPLWATSAAGALSELKAQLARYSGRRAHSDTASAADTDAAGKSQTGERAGDTDAGARTTGGTRIAREVQKLHREEQASLKKETVQAQRTAALKREERVLASSLGKSRASSRSAQPAAAGDFQPGKAAADTPQSHAAASRALVNAVRARSLDAGAPREDAAAPGRENTLADFIVAPRPRDRRAQSSHTAPRRLNVLEKSDSALRKGMLREGTYPIVTVGGIPHSQPAQEPPLQCPQPMPTMLHDEMHAMLCWTLQLSASTCSAVWATVPVLTSDTVGMALRRRVSSEEQMREAPSQVVFDVEEVQEGTTKGVNMGSMAAGFTYQGVGSAWEQHGQSIVHSSPLGLAWANRLLGLGKGMDVEVADCNAARLARLTVYDEALAAMTTESPPSLVATMSTSVGTELAVMRSALGGGKLGFLYQLFDEQDSSVGIMIEEGLAGAWLMQLERRQDVDLRAVAMLAATLR